MQKGIKAFLHIPLLIGADPHPALRVGANILAQLKLNLITD